MLVCALLPFELFLPCRAARHVIHIFSPFTWLAAAEVVELPSTQLIYAASAIMQTMAGCLIRLTRRVYPLSAICWPSVFWPLSNHTNGASLGPPTYDFAS